MYLLEFLSHNGAITPHRIQAFFTHILALFCLQHFFSFNKISNDSTQSDDYAAATRLRCYNALSCSLLRDDASNKNRKLMISLMEIYYVSQRNDSIEITRKHKIKQTNNNNAM